MYNELRSFGGLGHGCLSSNILTAKTLMRVAFYLDRSRRSIPIASGNLVDKFVLYNPRLIDRAHALLHPRNGRRKTITISIRVTLYTFILDIATITMPFALFLTVFLVRIFLPIFLALLRGFFC
nr:hypothetical protein Itr_chr09CG01700 [Ipomoea trifida]